MQTKQFQLEAYRSGGAATLLLLVSLVARLSVQRLRLQAYTTLKGGLP